MERRCSADPFGIFAGFDSLTVVPGLLEVAVPPKTESGADAKSARKARIKCAKACGDGLWSSLVRPLFRALGTLWITPNGL